MASSRKWAKFKDWLSGFFSPKGEVRFMPDGPQFRASSGGVFSHAQDFALYNPTMTSVQGDHNMVTYVQGDRNLVSKTMGLLSRHLIRGAAHDSSARTPPPRCHPGTRIKLIARITVWFESQDPKEVILWITGPAGVGKSAVVQTFAEHLVTLKLLGASVFFSRPNKRSNPHGVFITIAYQLATRIEAYRNFIIERLSLDPELLNGDMRAQFTAFIVEPFVEKKIGAGGKRWGILLDGLDELKGEDAQCEIIHLISAFTRENCDAPLAWIIASRPESHISSTFDDDEVRRSCWSEYIPIDSTEACKDVERFLRSSFKTISKKFQHSLPNDWPSDTEFLKLTAAASGLFIYAQVVMQFIRDPDHADPASRLEVLISIIDNSNATPTKENPFVHLDALYHEILSSIPSNLWPTAKQLLGFVSGRGSISSACRESQLGTLRGMSILLGLAPHVIYTSVIKCLSTLRVPDWKVAHKDKPAFLHASFADYLKDSGRSGVFYLGNDQDADDDVGLSLLVIWNKCSGDDIGTMEAAWHRYCLKWDDKPPSRTITKFHGNLFHDVAFCLAWTMEFMLKNPIESPTYSQLHKVHMIKLSYCFVADGAMKVVSTLMETMINDTELVRRVHLRDLKFGHLDWKMMSPARTHNERTQVFSAQQWTLHRPRSSAALKTFISELESIQEHSPELEVVIFGGVPEGRIAAFCHYLKNEVHFRAFVYYIIPYPE